MKRWQNCVAVVTGASSGIGEACARDLCLSGLRVVALARREELLKENHAKLSPSCRMRYYPRKCDITNETEVRETFDWIENVLGGTDILINNAGCLHLGNLLEMDSRTIDQILHTNIKGLIYCTQAAFRSMVKRDVAGHLIHVNSVAGQRVLDFGDPGLNIYPATKYAVTAMNETFRQELTHMRSKIKTTSIHPGLVRTEIFSKEFYGELGESVLGATDVSNAILFVISTPPHVLIKELTIKPVGEQF